MESSTPYTHPAPRVAQQIQHLLWISMVVSLVALAFSISTFGQYSVWLTPSAYVFTKAHNFTLLVLSSKERKRTAEERSGKLPPTATLATIICTWILALLWAAATATLIALCVQTIGQDPIPKYFGIVPWFEWVFTLVEAATLVTLALCATKERRAIVGGGNTAKWYQLRGYSS